MGSLLILKPGFGQRYVDKQKSQSNRTYSSHQQVPARFPGNVEIPLSCPSMRQDEVSGGSVCCRDFGRQHQHDGPW